MCKNLVEKYEQGGYHATFLLPKRNVDRANEVLKGREINKVPKMGITDFAITTYVERVQAGHPFSIPIESCMAWRGGELQ